MYDIHTYTHAHIRTFIIEFDYTYICCLSFGTRFLMSLDLIVKLSPAMNIIGILQNLLRIIFCGYL